MPLLNKPLRDKLHNLAFRAIAPPEAFPRVARPLFPPSQPTTGEDDVSDNSSATQPMDLTPSMMVNPQAVAQVAQPAQPFSDRIADLLAEPRSAPSIQSQADEMGKLIAMRLASQVLNLMVSKSLTPQAVARQLNMPIDQLNAVFTGDISNMTIGLLSRLLASLDARLGLQVLLPERAPQS